MKNFFLSLWYNLWYTYKSWIWKRKCIKYFGAKPETIYVSQRDYDALVEKINNPDPEQIESLRKLLQRPSPWNE